MTTPTTVNVRLQLRADTAANWTAANPTLLANEVGLETDTKKLKVGNGSSAWISLAYFPSIVSGGTVLGNLEIGTTGTLTFEGSTADGFETTLAVTNPTADRTITLPNQSGTVVVSGNASIVDADIAANAEIAVSKLADGSARQLLQTDAAGTGVEWTSNIDIPGSLDVTGPATFDGAVIVGGDLTVNGTTTNINTQNLVVEDKNIILGDVATPTDVTADGGGITLKGATDKTINWVDATDAWTSSERFSVPLGSAALPSLTFTGDENTGIYSPGADQVAISTAGVQRVFVGNGGGVGIGPSTSLGARLDVNTTSTDSCVIRARNDTTTVYLDANNGYSYLNTYSNHPFLIGTNNQECARIDSSGRLLVGTSSASGAAILQVRTPTTLSTTSDDGVVFSNTSTKTYPTTSNFTVTAGFEQNIELGTAQTVDTVTPGGVNFVFGQRHNFTKSAGNTQDIARLHFSGFNQTFTWADANTCPQYIGFSDTFIYQGIDANSRTSGSLSATSVNLVPPNGGTQTIANTTGTGNTILSTNSLSAAINITTGVGVTPGLNFQALNSGTLTANIINYTFLGTRTTWGTFVTGTAVNNATITNLYGLRLTAPSSSTGLTITNNWGISQEWSSAKNWFAGASNQFPNILTTASGANAFLDSADSNRLYRSTSSIVYKKDVENLDHALADNIHQFRPVWYRSKCDADCQDWSWFGLIAEEVAEIEPRLVHYGYQEDAYELVDVTETVELQPDDPRREAGQETEEITKQERRLKDDAQQVPNGVAYDRLTVLLLDVVQRQEDRIKDLEARLFALETA